MSRVILGAVLATVGLTAPAHAVTLLAVGQFQQRGEPTLRNGVPVRDRQGNILYNRPAAKNYYLLNRDTVRTVRPTRTPIYGIVNKRRVIIGYNETPGSVVVTPRAELYTTATASTATAGSSASFWRFLSPTPDAFPQVRGVQDALVTLSATSLTGAVNDGGGRWSQTFNGTLTVTRATPVTTKFKYLDGKISKDPAAQPKQLANLLTVQFTGARLVGTLGSTSAALQASTGFSVIDYKSDFMNFANADTFDWALSFSGLSAALTIPAISNPNNYAVTGSRSFGSFRANGTGTFAASSVPEPATWGMLVAGMGLVGGAIRRRRSSLARVAA